MTKELFKRSKAVLIMGAEGSGVFDLAKIFMANGYFGTDKKEQPQVEDIPEASYGNIVVVRTFPNEAEWNEVKDLLYAMQELQYYVCPIVVHRLWNDNIVEQLREDIAQNEGHAYTNLMKSNRKIYRDLKFHRYVDVQYELFRDGDLDYLNEVLKLHFIKLKTEVKL